MSVRIKLNNRKFLGEGLLIGSRLNEEGESQMTGASTVSANPTPAATASVTPTQPTTPSSAQPTNATPATTASVTPSGGQTSTTPNAAAVNQNVSTGNINEQLDKIIAEQFVNLANNVANNISSIKLPEGLRWIEVPKLEQINCATAIPAIQKFLQGNINVAKESIQKQAANTNNASTGNATSAQ